MLSALYLPLLWHDSADPFTQCVCHFMPWYWSSLPMASQVTVQSVQNATTHLYMQPVYPPVHHPQAEKLKAQASRLWICYGIAHCVFKTLHGQCHAPNYFRDLISFCIFSCSLCSSNYGFFSFPYPLLSFLRERSCVATVPTTLYNSVCSLPSGTYWAWSFAGINWNSSIISRRYGQPFTTPKLLPSYTQMPSYCNIHCCNLSVFWDTCMNVFLQNEVIWLCKRKTWGEREVQ